MRAVHGRRVLLVGAVAVLIMSLGSGAAQARDPYAGTTRWQMRQTTSSCSITYAQWNGQLPSGARNVTVVDATGWLDCTTVPANGSLRGTDTAGKAHVWPCSGRDVKSSLGDPVYRLTCQETGVSTGTFTIELHPPAGVGDPTRPSNDHLFRGVQAYAMAG